MVAVADPDATERKTTLPFRFLAGGNEPGQFISTIPPVESGNVSAFASTDPPSVPVGYQRTSDPQLIDHKQAVPGKLTCNVVVPSVTSVGVSRFAMVLAIAGAPWLQFT